jgi:hypothetical protein
MSSSRARFVPREGEVLLNEVSWLKRLADGGWTVRLPSVGDGSAGCSEAQLEDDESAGDEREGPTRIVEEDEDGSGRAKHTWRWVAGAGEGVAGKDAVGEGVAGQTMGAGRKAGESDAGAFESDDDEEWRGVGSWLTWVWSGSIGSAAGGA